MYANYFHLWSRQFQLVSIIGKMQAGLFMSTKTALLIGMLCICFTLQIQVDFIYVLFYCFPCSVEMQTFFLFDSDHNLKCIGNNWINQTGQTFGIPDQLTGVVTKA